MFRLEVQNAWDGGISREQMAIELDPEE
jgi:hypothetical protein